MSKAKIEYHIEESSGSDQNGKHLLGPIPDDDDELSDRQEEAMRMDGQTEEGKKSGSSYNFEEGREKSAGEDTLMTPLQGFGMRKTTSPAQAGMTRNITAGGAGALTKDFVITLWNNLPYETNKVRNLGHELRDEFKSVSDGYNCYHILTDATGDDSNLYFS